MNMCTLKAIKESIQECCQTQYDMDFAEIDQILQTLPFSQDQDSFVNCQNPAPPYRHKGSSQKN